MAFDYTIATPVFSYSLTTPPRHGQPGKTWSPGFDPETKDLIAWESMEYIDPWIGVDQLTLVFQDPFNALCNDTSLRELDTTITYSFGYEGMMTPVSTMVLARTLQSYEANGQIKTTLYFFGKSIYFNTLLRNVEYAQEPAKAGTPMPVTDVVRRIANYWGLTPIIVEPISVPGHSTRITPWKQQGQSDMTFLRALARGLRSSQSPEPYEVYVRDNELHFGPRNVNNGPQFVFEWRGVNSPLRSFSAQIPGEIMRGIGMIAGFGGFNPQSKVIQKGKVTVSTDTTAVQDKPHTFNDFFRGPVQDMTQGFLDTATPRAPVQEGPGLDQPQRSAYEAELQAKTQAVIQARHALEAAGDTPAEADQALAGDYQTIKNLRNMINGIPVTDPRLAAPDANAPDYGPQTQTFTEDIFRTSLRNMLHGQAEFFGFPLLHASRYSIRIDVPNSGKGTNNRFGGLWWVNEVRHRINAQGYVTTAALQSNSIGIGDPGVAGLAKQIPPDLTDISLQYDYNNNTGEASRVIVGRPTSAFDDAILQRTSTSVQVAAPPDPDMHRLQYGKDE